MNEKLERIKDRLVHGTGETQKETVREETAWQGTARPIDGAPAGPPEQTGVSPAGVLPGDRLVAGRRDDPARDGLADDDTAPTAVITDRPGDAPDAHGTSAPDAHGTSDAHGAHGAPLPGRGVPSPAPGGVSPAPGGPSPARDGGHSPTGGGPLFEHDADEIRRRWQEVQVGFVDDPRDSVTRADALLEELVGSLRTALERRTASLRQRWDGDEHDTERLRTALRDYRATVEQLLNLSSGTR